MRFVGKKDRAWRAIVPAAIFFGLLGRRAVAHKGKRIALIGAAFLALSVLIAGLAVTNTVRATKLAERAVSVRAQVSVLLRLLSEARAAERGYLLSGEDSEAAALAAANEALPGVLEALRAMIVRPAQLQRIDAVSSLLRERLTLGREVTDARRTGDADRALSLWLRPRLRDIDERIRRHISDFVAENSRVLADLRADYAAAALRQLVALVAAACVILLFGAQQIRGSHATFTELEASRARLRDANINLERQVAARTSELSRVNQLFATSLSGTGVTAFSQDRDLVYTWVYNPRDDLVPADAIGRSDSDLAPETARSEVIALKRKVIASGCSRIRELTVPGAKGEVVFKLHMDPLFEGHDVVGVVSAALDVTEDKLARRRIRELAEERAAAVLLFEIALRGAEVTVFAQDLDLRYIWVSHAMFGRSACELVGERDDAVLLPETRTKIIEFKRAVLASGEPGQGEFRHPDPCDERWYLLRAEPRRDETGAIVGLVGAAVDITDRRQRETHIRFLLRELTHRSKNLLAVIQAMARQTLTASASAADFEDRFSGRLQGLARSLDLLVEENWQGAAIHDLVRSQLSHYRDLIGLRIAINGPEARLGPEAAQNIGLALHELSTNSAKYGALGAPDGTVRVDWRFLTDDAGKPVFEFAWIERGGPPVSPPKRKGFGHAVIERLAPRALSGVVAYDFEREGVSWVLRIPAEFVQPIGEATPRADGQGVAAVG